LNGANKRRLIDLGWEAEDKRTKIEIKKSIITYPILNPFYRYVIKSKTKDEEEQ
jgi:hypothetical protein